MRHLAVDVQEALRWGGLDEVLQERTRLGRCVLDRMDGDSTHWMSAFQSCAFSHDSKSLKATSGKSRRSAPRSTVKPTRSNHSYILAASSPIPWRMTSRGTWK